LNYKTYQFIFWQQFYIKITIFVCFYGTGHLRRRPDIQILAPPLMVRGWLHVLMNVLAEGFLIQN
jgi:hypothetical protein